MGRKKKADTVEGSKKKHKKSKHKKHHGLEEDLNTSGNDGDIQRPIKLKIKLGDQLISSSNATIESPLQGSVAGDDLSSIAESDSRSYGASTSSLAGGAAEAGCLDVTGGSSLGMPEEELVESDLSMGKEEIEEVVSEMDNNDDEEAWLDALEAGEVNERGYLPQKVDVSTLTARQRAMLGGQESGAFEELMELPIGRATEELTEEMLLKKTERNRKRRIAAQKRKEKRKAETVRKLLEKQTTKKKEEEKTKQPVKRITTIRHVRYVNSVGGSSLSLPDGLELPSLGDRLASAVPLVPVLCGVEGCKNLKKYSHSITNTPLCSLACYKTLQSRATKLDTTTTATTVT